MECNREEAQKARDIAEKKMQGKDFLGARKFAMKAQQLSPEIEDISRMICVCDVHCCAENKVCGNEMDWYGILQIQQTADDTLIKKQYRKFALLLHPDKNKFAGAEAAFKLIGEAQKVLLHKEKRQRHDISRRTFFKPVILPQQASRNVSVVRQSGTVNSFSKYPFSLVSASSYPSDQEHRHHAQPGLANDRTFWTRCTFCSNRYQYFKDIIGKTVPCQKCRKTFFAYEIPSPGSGTTQPVFQQHNGSGGHVRSEAKNKRLASDAGFQVGQKAEFSRPQMDGHSQMHPNEEEQVSKLIKVNGQRGKQHVEFSDGDRQTSASNRNNRPSSGEHPMTKVCLGLMAGDKPPVKLRHKLIQREICLGLPAVLSRKR